MSYRSIYSAAKSAANVLTANLRMDLRTKYPRVHVSLVMPGLVDTNFQAIAGTPLGVRTGGRAGPTQIQSADEVAGQIVSLIENPVAELYTNQSSPALVQQYFRDGDGSKRT